MATYTAVVSRPLTIDDRAILGGLTEDNVGEASVAELYCLVSISAGGGGHLLVTVRAEHSHQDGLQYPVREAGGRDVETLPRADKPRIRGAAGVDQPGGGPVSASGKGKRCSL